MTARVRVIEDWRVEGMSEVCFAPDGRVADHQDHWDAAAQFYGRLPLVGPLLRWLGRSARVVQGWNWKSGLSRCDGNAGSGDGEP